MGRLKLSCLLFFLLSVCVVNADTDAYRFVKPFSRDADRPLHHEAGRYWEKFPQPPGRSTGVNRLGFDAGGVLWVMAGKGTYFWNADTKQWSESVMRSGSYLTRIYKRGQGGLYVTDKGDRDHWAKVYLLGNGKREFLTEFYYAKPYDYPGFYACSDGRIVNWGGGLLKIYEDGKWIKHVVDLPHKGTAVVDGGDNIALCFAGSVYVIDSQNQLKENSFDSDSKARCEGALLGGNKAVFIRDGAKRVAVVDLLTGEIVNSDEINSSIGKRELYDMFSTHEGDVYILARGDRELRSKVLYRVKPDSTVKMIRDTAGIPWVSNQFSYRPESVLTDKFGRIWLANHKSGLYFIENEKVKEFDPRIDGSPGPCKVLLEGPEGEIYVGTRSGLYVYNNGVSLTGRKVPEYDKPVLPGEVVWTFKADENNRDHMRMAWQVDDLVLFFSRSPRVLTAIDCKTGKERFEISLSMGSAERIQLLPGKKGEILISRKDHLSSIDAKTGKTLMTIKYKGDGKPKPVVVGNDYVIVRKDKKSLCRVTSSGSNVWQYPLSNEIVNQPSLYGPCLLIQTKGFSDAGKALSTMIDIDTGEKLPYDTTNLDATEFTFADGADYCVNIKNFQSPTKTEAILIAHDPSTGQKKWEFRRDKTVIYYNHKPVINVDTDLVYSVLLNGNVVCLKGETGEVEWETQLPCTPRLGHSDYYIETYENTIFLSGRLLMVSTKDHMLYVINAANGNIVKRMVITKDIQRHGKKTGIQHPLAGPWILQDLMIVPTGTDITAYRFANE
jgi:outer membrane protein assembly factor BamB